MPVPPNLPGGQLYMEYRHIPTGERHSLRIHLAYFDPTPLDDTNNRAYTSDGPVVPSDATIVDSYNSFAAVWQPYYNADWELRCVALLQYSSFTEVVQTPTPNFPLHNGTDTTELSGKLYFERKFKLLSQTGSRRELVLAQVIDTTLRPHSFYVGASSGGVDARDQALMAYFSGASGTGFVMPDGNYAFSDTEMSVWWNKQPEGLDLSAYGIDLHGWRIEGFNEDGTPEPDPGWNPNLFLVRDPSGVPRIMLDAGGWWLIQSSFIGSGFEKLLAQILGGTWNLSGDQFNFLTDFETFPHVGPEHPSVDYVKGTVLNLQLPWPHDEVSKAYVLGADTVDGPPVFSPPSPTTTGTERLGGGGDDIPLSGHTCTSMRCGVSSECTKHLISLYGGWTALLDPLISGITDFALFALVIDPFFDALIAGLTVASDIAIAKAVKEVLGAGVGAITGGLFPSPSSDDQEAMQRGLFCQLTCTGSNINIAATDINPVWHDYIAGLTLDGISRDLFTILIQFTPLADWQAISFTSGPSGLCDAWSCP